MNKPIDKLALLLALPLLTQAMQANAATCEDTLQVVESLYNNTVDECTGADGQALPASNCSGLIARGTERPERKGLPEGSERVYHTAPKSEISGNSSATYLRKDIPYKDPVVFKDDWRKYGNGFFVMPVDLVPPGQPVSYVACAAPVDIWADERNDQGCGDNRKTPEVETNCADAGITGANWVDRYFLPHMYTQTELIGGKSCTFDMRTMDAAKSTAAFKGFLEARRAMQDVPNQDTAFNSYTEVRFTNPSEGKIPPILAFYYSDESNRVDAEKNRAEYAAETGIDVPVIKVTYPANKNDIAKFSCDTAPTPAPVTEPAAGTAATQLIAGGWGTGSDPKQCSRYFENVTWINRWDDYLKRHVDSLSATPTACGREIGPDQTAAAFAELEAKAKSLPGGVGKWGDRTDTLRRQYVCHLTLVDDDGKGNKIAVKYKEQFNLEPIRKYVSHEQSLQDKCNTALTDEKMSGGWGPNGSAQCSEYVSSVRWVPRKFAEYGDKSIMSLEVVPTDCGRKIGPEQTEKMMAEIKQKALAADPRGAEYWGVKDDSMRRQTICLMKLYRDKPEWNIESIRPNGVSQQDAERAQCNFR